MATISLSLPSDGQTIDAADVNTPLNTISAVINGNLDDDNVKVGANINGTKLLINSIPPTAGDANMRGGWNAGIVTAMPTVTALGNRSYSLVHATTDLTGYLSPGMRLKMTRTVTAPTQCTSLNGTTQYYNKVTPTGISFTTTFTCSAWVKLSSYAVGGIIARRNADVEGWSLAVNASGQVELSALRIAANNKVVLTYQSLPLNKWVHIAATMDVTVAAATCATIYIDYVSVPYSGTLTGVCAALVQGTTDLVVGAYKSAGTSPFAGKIAQASVFSSVLSGATILAMANQTLSGAESTNVSAYSFNGIKTDLNANANNLTANGSAVETTLDTPFTQTMTGVTTGTTNYGIITAASFSTNTTLTVQVAEGDTIPTSGGVSAISYSTQKVPYGFPAQKNRWRVITLYLASETVSFGGTSQWSGSNCKLSIPVGDWDRVGYQGVAWLKSTVAGVRNGHFILAPATPTNAVYTSDLISRMYNAATTGNTDFMMTINKDVGLSLSAATTYIMYADVPSSSGVESYLIGGAEGTFTIFAEPAHL